MSTLSMRVEARTDARQRPSPGAWTLGSLSMSMLLSSLGSSSANVSLPEVAHSFAASIQEVQWIVLAYLLAVTTLIVGAGRLGDRLGRRRLLLTGLFLFSAASGAAALAPSLGTLIAARAVQGVGAAFMMALSMALISETIPKESTGRAMGLLGTMSAIGTSLGPSLGGLLISSLGWRAAFFVNAPLGIITLLMTLRQVPKDIPNPIGTHARFDRVGTVLLALTLASYALAMTLGRGQFGPVSFVLLLAAVGSGMGFVIAEGRAPQPLIRLNLFRDATLSSGLVTSALVSTVMMATLVVGSFYLTRALGLDAARAGAVMSIGPVVAALAALPAGKMADRLGAQRLAVFGLTGMVGGCLALALVSPRFGVPAYLAPVALMTLGYATFQTANNAAIMKDVRSNQRGLLSALLNLARNVGLITGGSAMGAVFALGAATNDLSAASPEAAMNGTRLTFGCAAVLSGIALAVALRNALTTARQPLAAEASRTVRGSGMRRLSEM
ncbi:MAG: MFS transporter [Verrucomicrobiales bacterium]|nr:MFS transporter [Verrucomicrobiales bacterium]